MGDSPLFAGVMSGTSLDGVDVALVRLGGREERPEPARLEAFRTLSYGDGLRRRLARACRDAPPRELSALGFQLGALFARGVREALEAAGLGTGELAAVGSHGQTVWHHPPADGEPARGADPGQGSGGHTLQIGEAAVMAEALGVPVIADFRVRDVAAGGHGAPLTPYFDRLLLSDEGEARGIQNLGGMGNLTALPAGGDGSPVAFDTGPGNALVDAAAERLSGGAARMDRDGRLAAAGEVVPEALEAWWEDPFFHTPPPRSTGRERFGPHQLEEWLGRFGDHSPEDLLATLTELTARSVSESFRWLDFRPDVLYLCGGGARNPELVRRIRSRVSPTGVQGLEALGWDPDAREAVAFALLARQHLLEIPASPAWATGARAPRVLGKRTPP